MKCLASGSGARRAFIFLGVFFVLAGCARIVSQGSQGRIWQSDPREPVWVTHSLPPAKGAIFLAGSGTSAKGRRFARKEAIRKLADSLLRTLESSGMNFTAPAREKLLARFEQSLDRKKTGPLVVEDRWEYKILPNPDDPFHVECHAWVLARVSVHFLNDVRHGLTVEDRERFRRIGERHRRIIRLLERSDGTKALLLLSRNRRSFSRIHSEHSFSKASLRRFVMLYRNEASLWGQFLETVEIRSGSSSSLPIRVSLHPFRSFSFPVRIRFRISGVWHALSGFRPGLSLEPLPEKLPFPPVPIYRRTGNVRHMPFRSAILWWAGDLGRYGQAERKNILASSCTVSSSDGVSVCHVRSVPEVLPDSSFRIVLEPAATENSARELTRVIERVPGHIPLHFLGRRATHVLDLRVIANFAGIPGKNTLSAFKTTLEKNLARDRFRIVRTASSPGLANVLGISLFRAKTMSLRVPSATIVVLTVPYRADVRDPSGNFLWERKGEARGAGFGVSEAWKDALSSLERSIPQRLDQLLWPISRGRSTDFFWSIRIPLLDGRAFCQEESS